MNIGTMTGLFDTFSGHSAVLTKFLRNVLKSRLYWPRGGILRVPGTGRLQADRARRVVPGSRPRRRTPGVTRPALLTTHSRPCRPSGARFAVRRASPRGGWVVPGIALPGTHRYTHPAIPTRPAPPACYHRRVRASQREQPVLGPRRRT